MEAADTPSCFAWIRSKPGSLTFLGIVLVVGPVAELPILRVASTEQLPLAQPDCEVGPTADLAALRHLGQHRRLQQLYTRPN